jgi:phage terminase large subunit-like protein
LSASELTRQRIQGKISEALLGANEIDIVDWIEDKVYNWQTVTNYQGVHDYSRAQKIILQDYQKKILRYVLTRDENGDFPYSTIVWSQPKKHGKTQIAGAVGAWFAENVEPPNMIYTLASNQEQSSGLIFNAMVPSIYAIGGKVPNTTMSTPIIQMPNGTIVRAIPNNYAGSAGGSYGLTLWSELWTYKSERDRRLWEEMPPVPTRKTSIRWVETYAGFENESDLLIDLFSRIFGTTYNGERTPDFTEKILQEKAKPVPGLEDIETEGRPSCWHIPEERLFVFWDHDIRAPWISDSYIAQEKAENRTSTFIRLWQNRWQTSEGTFIEPYQYDDCVTQEKEEWGPMVLAADASQRNDTTALIGVQRRVVKLFGKDQVRYKVMLCRVWDPEGKDIDLEETIAKYVKNIYDKGLLVGPFRYDPYQMHQVAINLRKKKVPCKEFPQGSERLHADTFLWKQFREGTLDIYHHPILEIHVKSANVKEYENEQVRIIKGTATDRNKVDAAVALSMAVWAASTKKVELINKAKKISKSYAEFEF